MPKSRGRLRKSRGAKRPPSFRYPVASLIPLEPERFVLAVRQVYANLQTEYPPWECTPCVLMENEEGGVDHLHFRDTEGNRVIFTFKALYQDDAYFSANLRYEAVGDVMRVSEDCYEWIRQHDEIDVDGDTAAFTVAATLPLRPNGTFEPEAYLQALEAYRQSTSCPL